MLNFRYGYSFIIGMFIGGYTNLFSKLIISGLLIYMVKPNNFNVENFSPLYDNIRVKLKPYLSKIYKFTEKIELPPLKKI